MFIFFNETFRAERSLAWQAARVQAQARAAKLLASKYQQSASERKLGWPAGAAATPQPDQQAPCPARQELSDTQPVESLYHLTVLTHMTSSTPEASIQRGSTQDFGASIAAHSFPAPTTVPPRQRRARLQQSTLHCTLVQLTADQAQKLRLLASQKKPRQVPAPSSGAMSR